MNLPRLVALTPGDLDTVRVADFLPRLARAVDAGLPGLLVREPRLGDRQWLELFERIRDRLGSQPGRSPVWLAVHDRAHLAAHVGADALHLGFRSLPPDRLRGLLRPGMRIGLSTHAGDDRASWRAADYLFHGPVRPTPSKEGWQEPVGFAGLAAAIAGAGRPVLAIGGLSPADVAQALEAGAHGVAVLSGIFGHEDPRAATEAYLAALDAPA